MALARRRQEREMRNGRQKKDFRDEDAAGQTPELGVDVLSESICSPEIGFRLLQNGLWPRVRLPAYRDVNVNNNQNTPSLIRWPPVTLQAIAAVTPPPP